MIRLDSYGLTAIIATTIICITIFVRCIKKDVGKEKERTKVICRDHIKFSTFLIERIMLGL